MLVLFLITFKLERCVNHAVKKLPFAIRYVPDRYKTQQMWDKAVIENDGMLKSVTD